MLRSKLVIVLVSTVNWMVIAACVGGCGSDETNEKASENDTEEMDDEGGREKQAADAGGEATEETPDGRVPVARIVAPETGSTVDGTVMFEFELDFAGQDLKMYFGSADEIETIAPDRFVSSLLGIDTRGYPNGEQKFVLELRDDDGQVWSDSVELDVDNPSIRFVGYDMGEWQFAAGEVVSLTAEFSEADLVVSADFSGADSAFEANEVEVTDLGEGLYEVRYTLSSSASQDGTFNIELSAPDPRGEKTVVATVPINLRNQPRLPFTVEGALFLDEPVPELGQGRTGAPLADVRTSGPLLAGSTTQLIVELDESDTVTDRLLVAVEGYRGYFVVPVLPNTQVVEATLASLKPDIDGSLDVIVSSFSPDGTSSGFESLSLIAEDVDLGGLQISLTWDAPVDMDLYVVDPSGTWIDFENPSANGGVLSLDANALCELSPSNAESITWPPGGGLPGEYEIRVNLFDACGFDGEINWAVVVTPGEGSLLTGPGKPDATDVTPINLSGSVTSSQTDTTGTGVEAGPPVDVGVAGIVGGRVRFQTIDKSGTSFKPVQNAPIRALTADSPDVPLGAGTTDDQGDFQLNLDNPDQKNFYLEISAAWEDPRSKVVVAEVDGSSGNLQTFSTRLITPQPDVSSVASVTIGLRDAGAFNIADVMRRSIAWVGRHHPSLSLPAVSALWDALNHNGGSRYFPNSHQFAIQGDMNDPDEFDDLVIAHEFNHFVQEVLTTPATGASHAPTMNPDDAYGEGIASAMALNILGVDEFTDSTRNAAGVLQFHPRPIDKNMVVTGGPRVTSPINEWLIPVIVLDLYDPKNETHDNIFEPDKTLETYFFQMPKHKGSNGRGFSGIDLVDFLDGFRCVNGANANSIALDPGLDALVQERSFKYTPQTTSCP